MRFNRLCGWLMVGLPMFVAAAQTTPPRRPNIILIMADDMGFSDLGCYGSEIATPNLDRLAGGGLRFTQFYNTARCCPTRAALLTGLYAHQAGVGHMVSSRPQPGYRGFLNEKCVTLAEALKQGGYRTYMAGKWHVGEQRPHWPVDRGFERYFGLVSGGSNYFRRDPERIMARDDQPYEPPAEGFYMTDAFTDAAIGFIQEHDGRQPFFLYLAYTAPHWPLHALPADIERYKGKYLKGWDVLRAERHARQIEMGLVDKRWLLTPRPVGRNTPAWADVPEAQRAAWDLKMAVYAAQIDRMDQNIGRLLQTLAASGHDQNTLILFLSDNGGCAESIDRGKPGEPPGGKDSFLSYGVAWANASNTPFRLYKHWVHEGGIATPLIAHWPGVIKPGGITDQVGHVIDLMATCLDAARVEYPKTYAGREIAPLEGKSLVPVFEGRRREGHAYLFWEHEGNRAVRQGQWKLVAQHGKPWELYDLQADRTELNDLADQHPQRVKEMAAQYEAWARRAGVVPWDRLNAAGR
ncbi:MAG: arylsulfatase [Phycisphaerae bacterium]|jgi:arylsulfatase